MSVPDYITKDPNDGSIMGQSASGKISFYGATPITQRTNANQAQVTTTALTTTSPFGFSTITQGTAVISLVNELQTALVNLGLIKGS